MQLRADSAPIHPLELRVKVFVSICWIPGLLGYYDPSPQRKVLLLAVLFFLFTTLILMAHIKRQAFSTRILCSSACFRSFPRVITIDVFTGRDGINALVVRSDPSYSYILCWVCILDCI